MKKTLFLIAMLGSFASVVRAADESPQTCLQIRERIKSVTGLAPIPVQDLLRQIGLNQACNFSSAEVYRAAYGDKPLPPQESRGHRGNGDEDDD